MGKVVKGGESSSIMENLDRNRTIHLGKLDSVLVKTSSAGTGSIAPNDEL